MPVIVAARFETFSDAENAAERLHARGFPSEDITTLYLEGLEPRQSADDIRATQRGTAVTAAGIGLVFALICGFIVWRLNDAVVLVVAGAGTGAYLGALWGALWVGGRRARSNPQPSSSVAPGVCDSGVVLVLHVEPDREGLACDVLKESGGDHIGRAPGRWREGKWETTGLPEAQDTALSAPADRN